MKKLNALAISAAVAGAVVSGSAAAELTGNIGLSNNYLWRGVTQTDDMAAISGGIDYANDSGIYVGGWVSNTDFTDSTVDNGTYELDVYFGYAGEAGSVGYDVGYIAYIYPLDDGADFSEVYGGIEVAGFGLNVAYTVDTDWGGDDADLYYSGSYSFGLTDELSLDLLVGKYDYDDAAADDYTHYSAYLSKGDFSFGFEANDIDGDDDTRVVVAWGQEFSL